MNKNNLKAAIKTKKFWIVIQNDKILLPNNHDLYFDEINVSRVKLDFKHHFNLGIFAQHEYFAAELYPHSKLSEEYNKLSLRQIFAFIDEPNFAIIAKGYAIIHWNKSYRFCNYCGEETGLHANRLVKFCNACQINFFPRISPSIIVLIYNNDQLIMARSHRYPPGVYGLIAGFVEIGETLEEAVHREVQEEIGLKIKNICYKGSQPWPFPDTLMLGFTAEYESGDIVIDRNELESAGWYRYNSLPGKPSLRISIASKLIEEFINTKMNNN